MNDREILEKMREYLTAETWIKDRFAAAKGDEIVGVCLQGACYLAAGHKFKGWTFDSSSLPDSLAFLLSKVIREQFPERYMSPFFDEWDVVVEFNDNPDTTLDNVHLVLDKAIAEVS